jgi:GNAT superfamily N-acetyltransferase
MTILEVNNSKLTNEFHKVPFTIYQNDKNWIPHIKQEVEKIFDKKKNKYFRHGEAIRWVVKNKSGKYVGRIAAFINYKTAKTEKQATGGIGFFESIENKEVAHKMFEKAKQWLQSKGMEAMDGPINFGEKDKYWGLLVEGFENPPVYGNAYQPKYYQAFFEAYGFQTYFEQYVYSREINQEINQKYKDRSDRILKNKDYSFRHLQTKKMFEYAEDFRTVYNKAWTSHNNFKGMAASQARAIMRAMKPVMDEQLIWFAYYKQEPVAFFIALPELNQIFKHIKGNLNLIGKIKFLFYKKIKKCDNVFGLAFGVSPDHQKKGLEGALIMAIKKQFDSESSNYKKLIITWIGDFNPKMIHIIDNLGAEKYMTLKTYRKLFNPDAIFERCKEI